MVKKKLGGLIYFDQEPQPKGPGRYVLYLNFILSYVVCSH